VNNMVGEYLNAPPTWQWAGCQCNIINFLSGVVARHLSTMQQTTSFQRLQKGCRSMRLGFGAVPCNVTVTKQFSVFNTCLTWKWTSELRPTTKRIPASPGSVLRCHWG
jgi:hypothetical protein